MKIFIIQNRFARMGGPLRQDYSQEIRKVFCDEADLEWYLTSAEAPDLFQVEVWDIRTPYDIVPRLCMDGMSWLAYGKHLLKELK